MNANYELMKVVYSMNANYCCTQLVTYNRTHDFSYNYETVKTRFQLRVYLSPFFYKALTKNDNLGPFTIIYS